VAGGRWIGFGLIAGGLFFLVNFAARVDIELTHKRCRRSELSSGVDAGPIHKLHSLS
jgi:hypothetical protein